MRCQECGSENLSCIASRESKTYPGRRRRRHKCQSCGQAFSTIEITVEEYEKLTTGKENHEALCKMRDRALAMQLAIKNESKGLHRSAVEAALRQILRTEE